MASSRTLITIKNEDKKWLKNYSRIHDISMAEAVRQGIQKLKTSEGRNLYASLVKRTYGIWRHGDGLKYQKNIREEWHPE